METKIEFNKRINDYFSQEINDIMARAGDEIHLRATKRLERSGLRYRMEQLVVRYARCTSTEEKIVIMSKIRKAMSEFYQIMKKIYKEELIKRMNIMECWDNTYDIFLELMNDKPKAHFTHEGETTIIKIEDVAPLKVKFNPGDSVEMRKQIARDILEEIQWKKEIGPEPELKNIKKDEVRQTNQNTKNKEHVKDSEMIEEIRRIRIAIEKLVLRT